MCNVIRPNTSEPFTVTAIFHPCCSQEGSSECKKYYNFRFILIDHILTATIRVGGVATSRSNRVTNISSQTGRDDDKHKHLQRGSVTTCFCLAGLMFTSEKLRHHKHLSLSDVCCCVQPGQRFREERNREKQREEEKKVFFLTVFTVVVICGFSRCRHCLHSTLRTFPYMSLLAVCYGILLLAGRLPTSNSRPFSREVSRTLFKTRATLNFWW